MPPRTAYSPVSRTLDALAKPLVSSQFTSASRSTILPGAAENVPAAILLRAATRWIRALTVVERMRGRANAERERARRESTTMRRAEIAASGDTRS